MPMTVVHMEISVRVQLCLRSLAHTDTHTGWDLAVHTRQPKNEAHVWRCINLRTAISALARAARSSRADSRQEFQALSSCACRRRRPKAFSLRFLACTPSWRKVTPRHVAIASRRMMASLREVRAFTPQSSIRAARCSCASIALCLAFSCCSISSRKAETMSWVSASDSFFCCSSSAILAFICRSTLQSHLTRYHTTWLEQQYACLNDLI